MNNNKYILIAVVVFFAAFFLFLGQANAVATTTPGSIVVVQNYRGAPFTWERWLKPVIYVWVEAGKTVVCVFNRNNTETNTCIK